MTDAAPSSSHSRMTSTLPAPSTSAVDNDKHHSVYHVAADDEEILLTTISIKVKSDDGSFVTLRALLDQGSQISLISENAAQRLGLKRQPFNASISGIGNGAKHSKGVVTLTCSSIYDDYHFSTQALIINRMINNLPNSSFSKQPWDHINHIRLADPQYYISKPIDILLDASVYSDIIMSGLIKSPTSAPIAQQTKLGWVLSGNVKTFKCHFVVNNIAELSQYWEIEDVNDTNTSFTKEEQYCEDLYEKTTTRLSDGRYEVALPMKPGYEQKLGNSKSKAIAQFYNLENKMKNDYHFSESYKDFMKEYESMHHMNIANNTAGVSYYLPHHGVLKSDSTTTRLRTVFNGSSKTSTGYSLNDLMERGPNLQQDLLSLILAWRRHKYVITADIEKMFRQIFIREADQPIQRIIWRYSPLEPLKEYQLTTITYGTKAAPYLAMQTLKQLAKDDSHKYPLGAMSLMTSFYMDDLLEGANTIQETQQLQQEIINLLRGAGMNIRKWSSNTDELTKGLPSEQLDSPLDFKYIFEDFLAPVTAAQTLIQTCCKKRKDMLRKSINLYMQVLASQSGEYTQQQRDRTLHMVGLLHDILLKKKFFKEKINSLISQYVFPEFQNPLGYMRARACWVLHHFAAAKFKTNEMIMEAVSLTVNALITDAELTVKVEAAIAIQKLLSYQVKALKYLEPQIVTVTFELLKVIHETEHDIIAKVLQKILLIYTKQLRPLACEITEHLARTFCKVIDTDSNTHLQVFTAMELLNTMETVLNVMEDNPEIMSRLEGIVLRVVGHILQQNIIEYYEETMMLLYVLTIKTISEDLWKVFELLVQVFEKEGLDYFTDMMPVLFNYITVDTNAFLSNEYHILAMFNMSKAVLMSGAEHKAKIYAAKLLEVMVLQCSGKIDHCLPSFVELVLNRLTRKVKGFELRNMLLQVVISILYYKPQLLLTILNNLQESMPTASITQHFIKHWIHDTDCFMGLHDRKLCVLGICSLREMGHQKPKILLPSCLVLFDGYAYGARAEVEDDSDSEEEEEEDEYAEFLSSDDDDTEDSEHWDNLARMALANSEVHDDNVTAEVEEDSDSNDGGDHFAHA